MSKNKFDTPIISILEGENASINFGDPELNEGFKSLEKKIQQQIIKNSDEKSRAHILKIYIDLHRRSDKELLEFYYSISEKKKKQLQVMFPKEEIIFLKQLMANDMEKKGKKEKESEQKSEQKLESQPSKLKEAPIEIFEPVEQVQDIEPSKKKNPPQERFDNLVKIFYKSNPFLFSTTVNHELEVQFGTKNIKPLNQVDYDNVVKKLKSSGFTIKGDNSGEYYLRINCEFMDNTSGRNKMSNVRSEIKGLYNVTEYCKTNSIRLIYESNPTSVSFLRKKPVFINDQKVYPVDFDDFNFRVSYKLEEKPNSGIINFIIDKDNWRDSKKEFRFINRVSFEHKENPFIIDLSIVKYGNRKRDEFGQNKIVPAYTIESSNVFNNQETYEIEIEIDNKKIGPTTRFNTPEIIIDSLRKVIKNILSGLQKTNYPISYYEQTNIMKDYMKLIWKDEPYKYKITSKNFIGPNSITLQLNNIAPFDENSTIPNIRKDFVVTEKADGERHLLYISKEGKIYLINTNMDVIFTGTKTYNEECFNTLMDGELISHDKSKKFINLYAAFDIYYIKNLDIRALPFMLLPGDEDVYNSRYELLSTIIRQLKPTSIMDVHVEKKKEKGTATVTGLLKKYAASNDIISPIRIVKKEFFPNISSQTIFQGCDTILQKIRNGLFEYNTDGLIFSHAFYGVGANQNGKTGPKTKITWEYSFKWKPPEFNTVDFLVTTVKGQNREDLIKSFYENGINTESNVQFNEYKVLELRCGFNESKDGYINPCQDIIDDKLPEYIQRGEDKRENEYLPKRFYPIEPYDPNAGLCNIMLRMDGTGTLKMFSEEDEVIEDNTIVEFSYDLTCEEGWRWKPLRVRYDKTAKLRRGEKEFGNSYKTCNENWKSIHPAGRITEDMLCSGSNIPSVIVSEDKYYNTPIGKFNTDAMKNFHNLYVKKLLILSVAKEGNTLIDFACGKAGDLPKWINAKLSFVFGIDISKDNLENRIDGSCVRFLNLKKTTKYMPNALFVNGNSAFNIKNGTAMLNEKARKISDAIFGLVSVEEAEIIGKGVSRQYQVGVDGFHVSSCQFAIHYFFKDPDTLKGFIKNVAECTKLNGYFIGTCYDGALVFNKLKSIEMDESIKLFENDKKIWEIIKKYNSDKFDDNSSSIGYKIDVFQESINQTISEYLVNFDYLTRVMNNYGFQLITSEEALELGLPNATGLFKELFSIMNDEIEKNRFKSRDFGQAPFMGENEKIISFLNRYFVFKKVRNVNTEIVELDLDEYEEGIIKSPNQEKISISKQTPLEKEETLQEKIIEEEIQYKPSKQTKVRKLSKKIRIVPSTEALDEINLYSSEPVQKEEVEKAEPSEKIKKPRKLRVSNKKITIAPDVEEINIPSEEIAVIEQIEPSVQDKPMLLISPIEKIKKPRKPRISNKKITIAPDVEEINIPEKELAIIEQIEPSEKIKKPRKPRVSNKKIVIEKE